jgi:ABC-type maltose transport system permease subunit
VNTDDRHQVVASGLYTMARSGVASSSSTMYSAYVLSSIPLLVLFIYATKPFIRGLTSGAVKL